MSLINDDMEAVLAVVRHTLQPWRRVVVGVDGRTHVGKTYLAHFLSWKCGVPLIETDLWITPTAGTPEYDREALRKVVERRLDRNVPLLIEGVFLLQTLETISLKPDYLIYVEADDQPGALSWQREFKSYERDYDPRGRAGRVFHRTPVE